MTPFLRPALFSREAALTALSRRLGVGRGGWGRVRPGREWCQARTRYSCVRRSSRLLVTL